MIWREKRIALIVLGVVLLANALFFFTYRVQYQARVDDLKARKEQTQARLESATRARKAAQQQLAAYRKAQTDLQSVYNDRWATEPQRLTAMITEVKRLAKAVDMEPNVYGFAETAESKNNDAKTNTTTVGINFTVQGSYQQIRRFINLLELSDQFVIIDSLSLASASDKGVLTMSLHLKTIFRDLPPTPANREM